MEGSSGCRRAEAGGGSTHALGGLVEDAHVDGGGQQVGGGGDGVNVAGEVQVELGRRRGVGVGLPWRGVWRRDFLAGVPWPCCLPAQHDLVCPQTPPLLTSSIGTTWL